MPTNTQQHPLRIALSFGAVHTQLARLLARQRTEEPETPVVISEVLLAEQLAGLESGRYDVGVAVGATTTERLKTRAIWDDELAATIPVRSPLLAYPAISLSVIADYPMMMWHPEACMAMHQSVQALFDAADVIPQVHALARSFEFMATLVAAGFGIGLAPRSWIDAARASGVVARPLVGQGTTLTTHLLSLHDPLSGEIHRFKERALARHLDRSRRL